jgi:hypothetical protein
VRSRPGPRFVHFFFRHRDHPELAVVRLLELVRHDPEQPVVGLLELVRRDPEQPLRLRFGLGHGDHPEHAAIQLLELVLGHRYREEVRLGLGRRDQPERQRLDQPVFAVRLRELRRDQPVAVERPDEEDAVTSRRQTRGPGATRPVPVFASKRR